MERSKDLTCCIWYDRAMHRGDSLELRQEHLDSSHNTLLYGWMPVLAKHSSQLALDSWSTLGIEEPQ